MELGKMTRPNVKISIENTATMALAQRDKKRGDSLPFTVVNAVNESCKGFRNVRREAMATAWAVLQKEPTAWVAAANAGIETAKTLLSNMVFTSENASEFWTFETVSELNRFALLVANNDSKLAGFGAMRAYEAFQESLDKNRVYTLKDLETLAAWFAKNGVLNARKAEKSKLRSGATASLDAPETAGGNSHAKQADTANASSVLKPDQILEGQELSQRVKDALEKINAQQAVAFTMAVNGHSYEEIAVKMDCGINTVKGRINKARTALKKILSMQKA